MSKTLSLKALTIEAKSLAEGVCIPSEGSPKYRLAPSPTINAKLWTLSVYNIQDAIPPLNNNYDVPENDLDTKANDAFAHRLFAFEQDCKKYMLKFKKDFLEFPVNVV